VRLPSPGRAITEYKKAVIFPVVPSDKEREGRNDRPGARKARRKRGKNMIGPILIVVLLISIPPLLFLPPMDLLPHRW
jgi:hypothetical protein